MLNKYTELYDKIVQDMVDLHNANLHFRSRISQLSSLEVRKAIKSLHAHTQELRKTVVQVQKEHKAFLKTQRLEYKAKMKEKHKAVKDKSKYFKKKETK